MAKVIYSFSVSVDGFVETVEASLDWVTVDEEWFRFVNERQKAIGAYLYGRGLYENMAAYWPTPEASDPANPEYVREWARIWHAMPKVVFSNTLRSVSWNSRLVSGDAVEEVERMKTVSGKDLAVGGPHLAASLIRHDLVDVYEFFLQPVILGSGTRYIPPLDERLVLKVAEERRFRNGIVQVRYERAR